MLDKDFGCGQILGPNLCTINATETRQPRKDLEEVATIGARVVIAFVTYLDDCR